MENGRKIFVVAGGELEGMHFFQGMFARQKPVAVICADGGACYLTDTGIIPDIVVGDMDSIDPETLKLYEAAGCRIARYPRRKDETDTELALREAFGLAPTEVWIWGALGGRIDHTLANISLLFLGNKEGVAVKLVDSRCEVFMINRNTVIDGKKGQVVSILPFVRKATGITLRGFEYPLENGEMEPGHPRGISNRLLMGRGEIEVASGELLIIRYFNPDDFE